MAKTPEEATATMIANMKSNTGKSLEEWLAVASARKGAKHGEIVAFLKSEHGLGHGFANLVAHKLAEAAVGGPAGDGELLDAQYAGAKAAMRPIYDAIAAMVVSFGGDVDLSVKKTYVSLRRSKQFGIVQPSTATRVDVGINLKGVEPKGRLEASGSFNAMVSHRVRIGSVAEVDGELKAWLKEAYEKA